MLDPEEILALVKAKVEIAKPFILHKGENRYGIGEKKGDLPEYYDGYNEIVKEAEDISIHAVKGIFPDKLFTDRSPNQTAEEFEYIKDNYKQTTLPVFIDYVSSITRPFHRSNWSIEFGIDEAQFQENTLQKYLDEIKLEAYMRAVIPPLKTRDAEGVIAVKPKEVPTLETEDGEFIIPDDVLIEPIAVYYESKRVLTDSKKYVLIELPEHSLVTQGTTKMQVGLVYEFYDEMNIYRIEQYGKRIDFTFEVSLYYPHNWEKVPVTKLKGVPFVGDGEWRWQSPFLFATDNLDLVVLNQSNLQASINKCVYPVRVMVGDVCVFEEDGNRCDGGVLSYFSGEQQITRTCPSCGGNGLKSRLSPLGELLWHPNTREAEGEGKMGDLLEYKAPEVTTLEFLRSEIGENEKRARSILHLNSTDEKVQGSLTATEIATNMKGLAAFVNTISDQMFDIYGETIDAIGFMRYGEDYKKPDINRPTTFDYTTEADYVSRIAEMTEAGVPAMVLHQVIMQYLNTIYMNEQKSIDVFTLLLNTDRLIGVSSDQINLKAARGTIQPFEDVIHCSGISLINELVLGNDKFFEQELTVQRDQLIAIAKTKIITPEAGIVDALTQRTDTI